MLWTGQLPLPEAGQSLREHLSPAQPKAGPSQTRGLRTLSHGTCRTRLMGKAVPSPLEHQNKALKHKGNFPEN